MGIHARIKQRREYLNMSQQDLAEKLGYKDRSTIAKIEKGINDIAQSKIEAFAEALKTTPAYLMGWVNEPTPDATPRNTVKELPPELQSTPDEPVFAAFHSGAFDGLDEGQVEMMVHLAKVLREEREKKGKS